MSPRYGIDEFVAVTSFRCKSGQAVIDACVSGLEICQLPDFYIRAVHPLRRDLLPRLRAAAQYLDHELSAALTPCTRKLGLPHDPDHDLGRL